MSKQRISKLAISLLLLTFLAVGCASANSQSVELEQSPGVEHPESAGFRVISREEIDPPVPAYNFSLTDQSGEQISLADLDGSVVMITFLYTHCPEACPLVAANFRSVQDQMINSIDSKELVQVLVTTDPERDTPERLIRYSQALGGDWYFLTGTMQDVQEVWDGYDIYREVKERTEEIVVFHSYKTYLIDQNGNLKFEFVGVWYPEDIIPDIQNMLNRNEEINDEKIN
jgi:protein SCO1/2